MHSDKLLQLTFPLSPFIKSGEENFKATKRIRPADSLNLEKMIKILKRSEIIDINIQGRLWSVISVYSPYSPDVHVMIMEMSTDRYIPSPELCNDSEGDTLMELWDSVLEFISKRDTNKTIHAGFNWSPRSWGEEEEKGGFQSIPTKWHTMIWGWPEFPHKSRKTKYAKWISVNKLSLPQRRVFSHNNYSILMGRAIRDRFIQHFDDNKDFKELFSAKEWKVDNRGLYLDFNISIRKLFTTKGFFSEVLKPFSSMLDHFMKELSEAFTSFDCNRIDRILKRIEKGILSGEELRELRAVPDIKPIDKIKEIFVKKNFPNTLISALLFAINNRCKTHGTPEKWWRKGFAYAIVFSSPCNQDRGRIRIMPGVYIGPGGVVEAKGVFLNRLENQTISREEIRQKSQVLYSLKNHIKNRF